MEMQNNSMYSDYQNTYRNKKPNKNAIYKLAKIKKQNFQNKLDIYFSSVSMFLKF